MAPLDLNIGLWFDCFTKIDRILILDIENISSEPVRFGMYVTYPFFSEQLRST